MRDLAKAMDTLSSQDAALLRMKYQQGLSIEQIARELALNQSAVKMRLKCSRHRVRQLYAKIAWSS